MDIFKFRNRVIEDYRNFARSFTRVHADDIQAYLDATYEQQHFWPAPLIQLNPRFVCGRSIEEMVQDDVLHSECANIFRIGKGEYARQQPVRGAREVSEVSWRRWPVSCWKDRRARAHHHRNAGAGDIRR